MSATGPRPAPLPETAFLADYTRAGAYTDCYAATLAQPVSLAALVEAFCTTRLFKLERWILATLLKLPSTDAQARAVAQGEAERFAAWRVERRGECEILLDAGQTRLWLSVTPEPGPIGTSTASTASTATTLRMGSAVVPMRPNGRFGLAFHALLGLHRLYSRCLLAATLRRLASAAPPSLPPDSA